jgi:hypothetical protein
MLSMLLKIFSQNLKKETLFLADWRLLHQYFLQAEQGQEQEGDWQLFWQSGK